MRKAKTTSGGKDMTTATARKATRPTARKRVNRERFDGENSDHWHAIPSKGQLYAMAIAAFNGAKFSGSECFTREAAKEIIDAAKEAGFLDK